MTESIGQLRFRYRGSWVAAELGTDLRWRCSNLEVVSLLTRASGTGDFVGYLLTLAPAEIRRLGRHSLYRAASRVGGRVNLSSTLGMVAPSREPMRLAGV